MSTLEINWNRFTQELENQVLAAQLSNAVLALIVVNVRQLPIFNFRLGFQGGERIVDKLIQKLPTIVPRAKSVERIAPGKIALIVPNVPVPELLAISAQKIIDRLGEPFLLDDELISVATTVGISIYPQHGTTAEALLSEAELSLLSSLANAKPFHIATKARSDKQLMLMQMGNELQAVIANESLSLHYQPKLDLNTMRPVSAETLMRWTLPNGSDVSPEEFIPVAEASGVILRLTEWAINTALREGGELNRSGGNQSAVAVNLSASTIYDSTLVNTVESALAIWDLPPQLLTLEVTESSLMRDPDLCFRNLSRIRDKGVKISIDDFGTGFSSLSYFKDIPADEIKIDQSFVKNMCDNGADEKIVGLIIDLSHKFDLKVVAEGIENEETLTRLRNMGCDIGQGFYFSKPMNLENYGQWLKDFDKAPLVG